VGVTTRPGTLVREGSGKHEVGARRPGLYRASVRPRQYRGSSPTQMAASLWPFPARTGLGNSAARRTAGSADIRVINPMIRNGREISVLPGSQRKQPSCRFPPWRSSPSRASKSRWSPTRSSPWSEMSQGKLAFTAKRCQRGEGRARKPDPFHIARIDAMPLSEKTDEGCQDAQRRARPASTDWAGHARTGRTGDQDLPFPLHAAADRRDRRTKANQFRQMAVRRQISPNGPA